MQGEYRGDFTRDTFHRANHFCRVLMQQGRVQLDADWNEQAAILLHYLRSLGRDVIGQHGGPNPAGFAIATNADRPNDLLIGAGHMKENARSAQIFRHADARHRHAFEAGIGELGADGGSDG